MWDGHERRSNRYGSFFLCSLTSEGKEKEPFRLYPENLPPQGARVKIQVRVKKTRKSWHMGDIALGVYPTTPKKGATIVLGVGDFSLSPSYDPKEATEALSLVPSDGRDEFWFDPRILYQLHDQTVEVYAEETQEAPHTVEPFDSEAEVAISNGDGTFQVKAKGDRPLKIAPTLTKIEDGLFLVEPPGAGPKGSRYQIK